jgi:hypothetical protein
MLLNNDSQSIMIAKPSRRHNSESADSPPFDRGMSEI